MTLQPLPCEFPYIWEKIFFFLSVLDFQQSSMRGGVNSAVLYMYVIEDTNNRKLIELSNLEDEIQPVLRIFNLWHNIKKMSKLVYNAFLLFIQKGNSSSQS